MTTLPMKPRLELIAVKIGGKRHLELIRAGYRTHHTDGQITYLEPITGKELIGKVMKDDNGQ